MNVLQIAETVGITMTEVLAMDHEEFVMHSKAIAARNRRQNSGGGGGSLGDLA